MGLVGTSGTYHDIWGTSDVRALKAVWFDLNPVIYDMYL